MSWIRCSVGVAALVLSAHALVAQQPGQMRPQGQRMMTDSAMGQHMQMMDSLSANLDSLVNRMNTATSDRKVAAMANVINALAAEHRMMHEHMRTMMSGHHGMVPTGKSSQRRPRRPVAAPDSAAHQH